MKGNAARGMKEHGTFSFSQGSASFSELNNFMKGS